MRLLRDSHRARRIAATLGIIAWLGVLLQFIAFVYSHRTQPHPIASATLLLFCFFTNTTNILIALVFTAMATRWGSRRWNERTAPGLAAASVVYILAVSLIYIVLLRPAGLPGGVGGLADIIMHYVMPISYPIFWMKYVRRCALKTAQIPFWLIYPLAFALLTELRGTLTGWYPYPFLNAAQFGYPIIFLNIAALTLLFAILAWAVVWTDRNLKAR